MSRTTHNLGVQNGVSLNSFGMDYQNRSYGYGVGLDQNYFQGQEQLKSKSNWPIQDLFREQPELDRKRTRYPNVCSVNEHRLSNLSHSLDVGVGKQIYDQWKNSRYDVMDTSKPVHPLPFSKVPEIVQMSSPGFDVSNDLRSTLNASAGYVTLDNNTIRNRSCSSVGNNIFTNHLDGSNYIRPDVLFNYQTGRFGLDGAMQVPYCMRGSDQGMGHVASECKIYPSVAINKTTSGSEEVLYSQSQLPQPRQCCYNPPINTLGRQPDIQSQNCLVTPGKLSKLVDSCNVSSYDILLQYKKYKRFPANLGIPLLSFLHSTNCSSDGCLCEQFQLLVDHFDNCNDSSCRVCDPLLSGFSNNNVRSASGTSNDFLSTVEYDQPPAKRIRVENLLSPNNGESLLGDCTRADCTRAAVHQDVASNLIDQPPAKRTRVENLLSPNNGEFNAPCDSVSEKQEMIKNSKDFSLADCTRAAVHQDVASNLIDQPPAKRTRVENLLSPNNGEFNAPCDSVSEKQEMIKNSKDFSLADCTRAAVHQDVASNLIDQPPAKRTRVENLLSPNNGEFNAPCDSVSEKQEMIKNSKDFSLADCTRAAVHQDVASNLIDQPPAKRTRVENLLSPNNGEFNAPCDSVSEKQEMIKNSKDFSLADCTRAAVHQDVASNLIDQPPAKRTRVENLLSPNNGEFNAPCDSVSEKQEMIKNSKDFSLADCTRAAVHQDVASNLIDQPPAKRTRVENLLSPNNGEFNAPCDSVSEKQEMIKNSKDFSLADCTRAAVHQDVASNLIDQPPAKRMRVENLLSPNNGEFTAPSDSVPEKREITKKSKDFSSADCTRAVVHQDVASNHNQQMVHANIPCFAEEVNVGYKLVRTEQIITTEMKTPAISLENRIVELESEKKDVVSAGDFVIQATSCLIDQPPAKRVRAENIAPSDSDPEKRKMIKKGKEFSSADCGRGLVHQDVASNNNQQMVGASLVDILTADHIEEHLQSLGNVTNENSMDENSCQLCSMRKLMFKSAPTYCSYCNYRFKRKDYQWTINEMGVKYYFCGVCFKSRGEIISVQGHSFCKSKLTKTTNIKKDEEAWVQCDKCERWQHQICGLYNSKDDSEGKAKYICMCCRPQEIKNGEHAPLSNLFGANDLPRTNLSDHIEHRLLRRLKEERQERATSLGKCVDEVPGAENLVVRVALSVRKSMEVTKQFLDIIPGKNYPSEFSYNSKVVLLFQKIKGVDVCIFAMSVQEYGSDCLPPNRRSVYISYLDSVKYFQPEIRAVHGEALRTFVYHEILIGYLEYCKKLGLETCYIYACPPEIGDDYLFNCHPESQKTPKSDKLRNWYKSMLLKAKKENVVSDCTNFYDKFFVPNAQCGTKVTTANLPYFDGDFWSVSAIELMSKDEKKKVSTRALKSMGYTNIPSESAMDISVMHELGEKILEKGKENFIVVNLQSVSSTTDDEDVVLDNDIFASRDHILSFCRENFYLFDSFRHAKYSSMMILYHLHKKLSQCSSMPECATTNKRLQPKQKPQEVEDILKSLVHAFECRHSKENPCSNSRCSRLRKLFHHVRVCKSRVDGGCQFCKIAWDLLYKHSRSCEVVACQVPNCRSIKMSTSSKATEADNPRRSSTGRVARGC